ncbi:MAG TPA: methyltransferase domain-containing protein [Gaiellaceae bacterium]|nr:methyltransferase domain-containing protein [Gaiellaceae bacterium]
MSDDVPLYTSAYAGFDVRNQVRQATYGDDIGQSGWLTSNELDRFAEWLNLSGDSRLLDVGCGSGGPALRLAETTSARIVGIDRLKEGTATATRLAEERGLADRAEFMQVDAGRRLPFADQGFDAVLSIDVMCHLPNRLDILREWQRVTAPGGRILFTDPTIVTGLVTATELEARSSIGTYVFSAETNNEKLLIEAGFELVRCDDLTENMAAMAGRWHDARARFRDDLVPDEGERTFEGIQRFLAASHLLAREGRLSRYAYLALR